jgi:hypothetical protein
MMASEAAGSIGTTRRTFRDRAVEYGHRPPDGQADDGADDRASGALPCTSASNL